MQGCVGQAPPPLHLCPHLHKQRAHRMGHSPLSPATPIFTQRWHRHGMPPTLLPSRHHHSYANRMQMWVHVGHPPTPLCALVQMGAVWEGATPCAGMGRGPLPPLEAHAPGTPHKPGSSPPFPFVHKGGMQMADHTQTQKCPPMVGVQGLTMKWGGMQWEGAPPLFMPPPLFACNHGSSHPLVCAHRVWHGDGHPTCLCMGYVNWGPTQTWKYFGK